MKQTVIRSLALLVALFSFWNGSLPAHDSENSSARVVHDSRYSGNTGTVPITAKLKFFSNDHVEGTYVSSRTGQKYLLRGHNHTEGKIFLREYTQEDGVWGVTATCTLRKKIQNGKVVWSGTMNNTDGRSFGITLRKEN